MMTEDQMHQAERDAALTAVAHALTADERVALTSYAYLTWPGFYGAGVADVLEATADRDLFLSATEPFYQAHKAELRQYRPAVTYAMHALVLLQQPLTVKAVLRLLVRAGVTDAPGYDVIRDLALVLDDAANSGRDRAPVLLARGRLREHLDLSTAESAEAGLRALLEG
jgi:hypothetical protein